MNEKWLYGPEKFPGLSRNGPQVSKKLNLERLTVRLGLTHRYLGSLQRRRISGCRVSLIMSPPKGDKGKLKIRLYVTSWFSIFLGGWGVGGCPQVAHKCLKSCSNFLKKNCLNVAPNSYPGPRGFLLILSFLFGNLRREALT